MTYNGIGLKFESCAQADGPKHSNCNMAFCLPVSLKDPFYGGKHIVHEFTNTIFLVSIMSKLFFKYVKGLYEQKFL